MREMLGEEGYRQAIQQTMLDTTMRFVLPFGNRD